MIRGEDHGGDVQAQRHRDRARLRGRAQAETGFLEDASPPPGVGSSTAMRRTPVPRPVPPRTGRDPLSVPRSASPTVPRVHIDPASSRRRVECAERLAVRQIDACNASERARRSATEPVAAEGGREGQVGVEVEARPRDRYVEPILRLDTERLVHAQRRSRAARMAQVGGPPRRAASRRRQQPPRGARGPRRATAWTGPLAPPQSGSVAQPPPSRRPDDPCVQFCTDDPVDMLRIGPT